MAEQSHGPQARRSVLRLALAGLVGLGLGACQLVPEGSSPPPQVALPQPMPEAQPEPDRNLPADRERNRVAVLVPLTGANAGVGRSIANAANLALLDTGGERIRITVYDTAKDGAAIAARQAIQDGNGLILGPLLAEDVRAVAPVAAGARVPVLSFSNDVSVAQGGVYVMGFTPGQSVARVVGFARSRGSVRFAALTPEGVYGTRAGAAFREAVERSGGRVVAEQGFDRGAGSLRTAVVRLNGAGGYDSVLIADSGRTAAAAAPLIRGGSSAHILGTELWSNESGLGAAPTLRGAWYAGASDTLFDQLRTRYRTRYGAVPYRLSSLGYDAVLLAMRVAKDWRPGQPFPVDELRDRSGFPGIDGLFRFGADGVIERALEVREVTAAGTTIVSPAPRSFD
jgi:branched-chain amino acid transport system substrate-binding protein